LFQLKWILVESRIEKHSPAFIGPFVVVQLKNNLAKLVHFYTGKTVEKIFINVDKLKRLRDEPREVLYNRHKPTQQSFSMDNDELAQRTVQPAIETASRWCAEFIK
jgi:hypothetical protein